jgi:hypothetical protein
LRDKFLIPWDRQVAEEYIIAYNPYHVAFPNRLGRLTKYRDASALGSGDHADGIGKLHEDSVLVFERHGLETFSVNSLCRDLARERPRSLVQAFAQKKTLVGGRELL